MKKNLTKAIGLLLLCFSSFTVLGQTPVTVSGTITDSENGEPILGATVVVKNTRKGTITSDDGKYSIICQPKDILVFYSIGFVTVEIPVDDRNKIDVVMRPADSQLDELVVVGYGQQKKSQISSAISSINNKDFKDQPVSNLANSIQGRVSGLSVTVPSGTPGAGLMVNIRGYNNPLYVVDGIPMISDNNSSLSTAFDLSGANTGSGQTLSSITDINPNDIESIEVLKDASAAAIYGARAANGVVLITTKRGREGRTETNFNYYTGLQRIMRPIKFMNSQEMRDLAEEARANDYKLWQADNNVFGAGFDPSILTDPLVGYDVASSPNTNWLNEVTRTAPVSNYELSLKGGNQWTRFFTSVGYYDQKGILIENFYKRFNYRLNLDHQLTDKMTVGAMLSTTFSRNRRSFNDNTYTGIITNALGASPFMPVYETDGSYADYTSYQANWLSDNPVKSAKEIKGYTNSYRVLGSTYLEYTINKYLKAKSTWSADGTFLFDNLFKSPITVDAEAVGGQAYEGNFRGLTLLNENTLNYSRTFNQKHNVNLLGGMSVQKTTIDRSSATGNGFPATGLEKVSSAAAIVGATSTSTSYAVVSYIARVNYGFDNRYLFTGSLRTDGSSRFSKENRYGTFPSMAFAWRLNNESFFPKSGIMKNVTDLKARLSYGLTGDQEIGDFQNVTFYTASRYDNKAGIQLRNVADPTLSWQQNRMTNFGIDYEILNGRFSGAFEMFSSLKNRLLSEDIIPSTTGFTTVTRNSGSVRSRGMEFNINASIYRQHAFRWDVGFNFTHVKNKIMELSTDSVFLNAYSDLDPTHILRVGSPIGSLLGVKWTGVNPQTGDNEFEDVNGDGVIDADDSQIIGRALPTWFGGITNNLQYKNFDLSVFIRFSGGNQVYNMIRATTENLGWSNEGGTTSVYANNTKRVLNRWKQPGDNTDIGRASFVNANVYQNSSMFIENGSFIRIQNINLGYNIRVPKKFLQARVYVEAQNLAIISRYTGFDPEVSSTGGLSERTAGIDYGAYPSARTFLLGVNFKF